MPVRPWHHYLRQILFLPMLAAAWLAPRSVQRWLASTTARFVYVLAPRLRRRLERNLRQARPGATPDQIRRSVIAVLRNYGCYLLDFFALMRGPRPDLLRREAGPEVLQALLDRGKGAILATAHLGSWEIAGLALARKQAGVAMVSAAEEIGYLGALRTRIRGQLRHREILLEDGPHAMIELLGRLRDGGLVGLQMDRVGRAASLAVPFLGARLRMPRGPARLATLSGAPILPVFAVFNEEGTYDLIAEEPIDPEGRTEEELLQPAGRGPGALRHHLSGPVAHDAGSLGARFGDGRSAVPGGRRGGAVTAPEPDNVLEQPLEGDQLRRLLPHRPPFLFVRRLTEWRPGQFARSEAWFDPGESFFAGHFPGNPIVPGVILTELAAQTAGLALSAAGEAAGAPFLAKIKAFRFRRPVKPAGAAGGRRPGPDPLRERRPGARRGDPRSPTRSPTARFSSAPARERPLGIPDREPEPRLQARIVAVPEVLALQAQGVQQALATFGLHLVRGRGSAFVEAEQALETADRRLVVRLVLLDASQPALQEVGVVPGPSIPSTPRAAPSRRSLRPAGSGSRAAARGPAAEHGRRGRRPGGSCAPGPAAACRHRWRRSPAPSRPPSAPRR